MFFLRLECDFKRHRWGLHTVGKSWEWEEKRAWAMVRDGSPPSPCSDIELWGVREVYIWPVSLKVQFICCRCSVSRSCLTLQPHGLQHARLPCPSPSPRVCSNSCPSSRWRHSTISSSVIPFSPCLQSFPASESFLMSWLFTLFCIKDILEAQNE